MSSTAERPKFSPADLAEHLRLTQGIGAVAAKVKTASSGDGELLNAQEPSGPFEGRIIERDSKKYRFERASTGRKVWDSAVQELVPEYHSLKTYFSHHTVDVGPGPGWDTRYGLLDLEPNEMIERYGHVFTREEVFSPMGQRDELTDELVGGMPNEIPYYKLVPFHEGTLSNITPEVTK